jgi:hypothetical protein
VVTPEQDREGCIATIKAAVREGGLSLTLLSANLTDVFLMHKVCDAVTQHEILRACGLTPQTFDGAVTFSPPEPDQAGCLEIIKAFTRGGAPGLRCLLKVLPNVFKSHFISDAGMQNELLRSCDLVSINNGNSDPDAGTVSFLLPEDASSPKWTRVSRARVEGGGALQQAEEEASPLSPAR